MELVAVEVNKQTLQATVVSKFQSVIHKIPALGKGKLQDGAKGKSWRCGKLERVERNNCLLKIGKLE